MKPLHCPVMSSEVLAVFKNAGRRVFLDCTLGMGGHAGVLLREIPGCRVIGIDLDAESLQLARVILQSYSDRFSCFQADFLRDLPDLPLDFSSIGGILVDPGLSMDQLKDGRRGFSHSLDGPLDMRKNRQARTTAADLLNSLSGDELADLFGRYGEVPDSRRLARRIVERRLLAPLSHTGELRDLIESEYKWHPRRGLTHPAARVFQALRIAVNSELEGLPEFIRLMSERLAPGSALVFLSYHSLEDRVVKNEFNSLRRSGRLNVLKPFPAFPSAAEVDSNPAARSARMRAGVLL